MMRFQRHSEFDTVFSLPCDMTVRSWLRGIAVILFGFGVLCLPQPGGVPARFTNLFSTLVADSGVVLHLGLGLVGISIVLFAVTFIGRSDE
jgi:hypothetical protein